MPNVQDHKSRIDSPRPCFDRGDGNGNRPLVQVYLERGRGGRPCSADHQFARLCL
jgi:hypothetical protein